jgi:hypothetical protein
MNILKYFSALLLVLSISHNGYSQDLEKPGAELWKMVQIDTFPFLRSMDAIYMSADVSLMSLFVAKNTPGSALSNVIANAYYYNLLAGRTAICDSIIKSVQKSDTAYVNLLGHIALKDFVPCFGVSTPYCDSIRMKIVPLLKEASIKSELMPKDQWKWLYQLIDGTTLFNQSQTKLILSKDSLQNVAHASWEGGVLSFNIKEGKQNLLISNGVRKPVQVLEINNHGQWMDITASTHLDLMPGGHQLYNIDYNGDGLDDLFILRKSSSFKSPAIYRPSLLLNLGNGTFEDIAVKVGLERLPRPNCACWSDINGDGKLDVFIGNEYISSAWMVQNEEGIFENQANSYNIVTNKKNVINCLITDLNKDGKNDLMLSLKSDSNLVYIQEMVNNQYRIFKEHTDKYDIKEPVISKEILSFDYALDGNQEILVKADYNDNYDATADILTRKDTIDSEPSYFMTRNNEENIKFIASPEVSLMRAGVVLENHENIVIIGGGGQNTESLYPMFQYEISPKGHAISIALPENWPAYVHSMTAYADSLNQPILIVKGGGNYPFMVSRISSYQIGMPEAGKFVRLFDYSKVNPGSLVKFDYTDTEGKVHPLTKTVKALDSKGYNALQEWIWAAKGAEVKNIEVDGKAILPFKEVQSIDTPSKKGNKAKKEKKKK